MCGVIPGAEKTVHRGTTFRPFSDFQLASDPARLRRVAVEVVGDVNVAEVALKPVVKYAGTHEIVPNAAYAFDGISAYTEHDVDLGRDVLRNVSDRSEGVVERLQHNGHGIVPASLAGGTRNNFAVGDRYNILSGATLDRLATSYEMSVDRESVSRAILRATDVAGNVSEASALIHVV